MQKLCFFYFLFFNLCIELIAQPTSQTFNSSGTYTVPSGYSANVTIEAWGAGGGGGSNSSGAKGGGGGGAYASSTTTLSAGSYTVTVGTGGGAATAGGSSSFTTIVVAVGGQSTTGTTGGAGGSATSCTGTTTVSGTNGNNASGDNGGSGGAGANGGGAGGAGGVAQNGSGSSGTAPGGGGGGKAGPGNAGVSGSGANGRVVVTVNIVVPLRFGAIQLSVQQNGVLLEWVVYGEQDMKKYIVEKSTDATAFISTGEVLAKNSSSETTYQFFDANPGTGLSFYRIRAVDNDGRFSYSNTLRFNRQNNTSDLSVYPNPVIDNKLVLQTAGLPNGAINISVYNRLGQNVLSQNLFHNGGSFTRVLQLDADLQGDLYYVILRTVTGFKTGTSFILVK